MKAISEFVLVLLILIITTFSISTLWLYLNGYFRIITLSDDTSELGEVLSSCMKIDSARNNKIYLRNCGDGVVRNNTLKLYFDETSVNFLMSPSSIGKGQIAEITLSELWKLTAGDHRIRFETKAGKVERYIKVKLHDSCVLALNFDEGSGNITYDSSGYDNNGILNNFNIYNCSSVGENGIITISCPPNKFITSIENSVYVEQSNPASCSNPNPGTFCNRYCNYSDRCIGKNFCSFPVTNANCGGDPCSGIYKKLILNVSCNYWVDGKFGKALEFDGINDYIQIPNSASLNIGDAITVAAWIKTPSDTASCRVIATKTDLPGSEPVGTTNWMIHFVNNELHFFVKRAGVEYMAYTPISANAWQFVVGTYNGSHIIASVNGVLGTPVSLTGALPALDEPVLIGTRNISYDYFSGIIDDVRVYNKALTLDETVSLTLGELD